VADALQGLRIVHDGESRRLKQVELSGSSCAEAEKFIEDYYLARGVIAPPAPKTH
jgi:hypothetical protein